MEVVEEEEEDNDNNNNDDNEEDENRAACRVQQPQVVGDEQDDEHFRRGSGEDRHLEPTARGATKAHAAATAETSNECEGVPQPLEAAQREGERIGESERYKN